MTDNSVQLSDTASLSQSLLRGDGTEGIAQRGCGRLSNLEHDHNTPVGRERRRAP